MSDRLTHAIQTLVEVFHEYACKDEEKAAKGKGKGKGKGKEEEEGGCKVSSLDQFKLSKGELKELMEKELNMDNVKDPCKLEALMKELDANGDGQVNFEEFVVFMVSVSCICNDFLEMILMDNEDCV